MQDMHVQLCAIMEVYVNKCMENQGCKLFALTDGAVIQDMLAMPQKKLKKILSNY